MSKKIGCVLDAGLCHFDAAGRIAPKNLPGDNSIASFDFQGISPILRTLLLSDATVTKFLEAYFEESIRITVLEHAEADSENFPALSLHAGRKLLRRRTTFRGARTGRIYCGALSLIRSDLLWPGAEEDLIQGRVGIGELLREKRIETYREILTLARIDASELAADFGLAEPDEIIRRSYRIFVDRAPCMHITDYYSPALFL